MLEFSIKVTRPQFTLRASSTITGKGITAVFGHSGSGKSTLLNCLAGFMQPDKGSFINLDGRRLLDTDGNSLSIHERGIAYVTQQSSLFPHLTIDHNLDFAITRCFNKKRISKQQLCENMGLVEHLHKMPSELSGGEQQRAAIARALLSSPYILLLDEPLNALDASARENILGHLEQLHEHIEVPVMYVTHSSEELMRLSDNVIVLSGGEVVTHQPTAKALSSLSTPLGDRQDVGIIIEGDIQEFDAEYKLCKISLGENLHLWVSGRPPSSSSVARIRIYAKDVSIALNKANDTSILNILPAKVCKILDTGYGQSLIELQCGSHTLLAKLTNKSVKALSIVEGKSLYAQIKSIALLGVARETPAS